MKIHRPSERLVTATCVASLALFASCGGGGGGGGGGGPGPGNSELEAALNDLGVDTRTTAREDEEGDALPASYSPFGATWSSPRRTSCC